VTRRLAIGNGWLPFAQELEPTAAEESPDFDRVYFIEGPHGNIKIGHSRNIELRMMSLQAANPGKLRLLLDLPGGAALEGLLHIHFREHRLSGEWFSPVPDLMALIADPDGSELLRMLREVRYSRPLPKEPTGRQDPGPTEKQIEILNIIAKSIRGRGFSPTVRELCAETATVSTNGVAGHLYSLERRGLLKRANGKTRAYVPTPSGWDLAGGAPQPRVPGVRVTGVVEEPSHRCSECDREFFGDSFMGHRCHPWDIAIGSPGAPLQVVAAAPAEAP
jgi:hypothetical protein